MIIWSANNRIGWWAAFLVAPAITRAIASVKQIIFDLFLFQCVGITALSILACRSEERGDGVVIESNTTVAHNPIVPLLSEEARAPIA